MVTGEGGGMEAIGRGVSRGGVPAPTDRLLWLSKVPPIDVGFRPAHQLTHWGGVLPGG